METFDSRWDSRRGYISRHPNRFVDTGNDEMKNITKWLSSFSVVTNVLIALVAFTIGERVGLGTGRKATAAAVAEVKASLGPIMKTVPVMTDKDKQIISQLHEQIVRNRANGIAAAATH